MTAPPSTTSAPTTSNTNATVRFPDRLSAQRCFDDFGSTRKPNALPKSVATTSAGENADLGGAGDGQSHRRLRSLTSHE
jgi:hypothetical protein